MELILSQSNGANEEEEKGGGIGTTRTRRTTLQQARLMVSFGRRSVAGGGAFRFAFLAGERCPIVRSSVGSFPTRAPNMGPWAETS